MTASSSDSLMKATLSVSASLVDYGLPICDAVERSPKIKWIGCTNELNASYAAVLAAFVVWFSHLSNLISA